MKKIFLSETTRPSAVPSSSRPLQSYTYYVPGAEIGPVLGFTFYMDL